jgi:hypothetical protein
MTSASSSISGRLLGTYKAYDWKPPANYRFTFRGLFEIKWY